MPDKKIRVTRKNSGRVDLGAGLPFPAKRAVSILFLMGSGWPETNLH